MRIVASPGSSKQKPTLKRKAIFICALLIIVAAAGIVWHKNNKQSQTDILSSEGGVNNSRPNKKIDNPTIDDFKYFAGEDFQKLYENIAYPNTQVLASPSSITGNPAADERIRTIAASRGYLSRSVPVMPIDKTNAPGLNSDDLLQPRAHDAWLELKKAAESEGIPLKLNSGYRSVEMQRQLFLDRLRAAGVNYTQIANAQADNQVVAVLSLAAIPGYSRHHTGYTLDFVCANGSQEFKVTTCFKWLSKNNYFNAKRFGFIPSYPDGAPQQGPEPEPWEYVWVGVEPLLK